MDYDVCNIVICSKAQVQERPKRWRYALEKRLCVNERNTGLTVKTEGVESVKLYRFKH